MTSMEVRRYDQGSLRKARRDGRGFLRVPAALTRTGVFSYKRADGTTVRELRHPDEVFSQKSLETLKGAPLTRGHPSEAVTAGNAGELEIGVVGDDVRQDGRLVQAELQVRRASAITEVEAGKLRELSCGYSCNIDPTPGVFEGERYDQVQRDIHYNHVGAGPEGWGRAGADVRLRLDSGDAVLVEQESTTPPNPSSGDRGSMKTVRIDGLEFEAPESTAQAIQKDKERRDAAQQKLQTELDEARGEAAALRTDNDDLKKQVAELSDESRLDARVEARASLQSAAQRVLGEEFKCDGLSDREVHVKCLEKLEPELKLDGESDDFVRAAFKVAASKQPAKRDDENKAVVKGIKTTPGKGDEDGAPGVSRLDSAWEKRNKLGTEPSENS